MISQFDGPEDTLRRKRLKVSSACTQCRRRKTKCDGSRPCASCNKAKVECHYVSSTRNNTNNGKIQQKHTTTASSSRPTITDISTSELKQQQPLGDPHHYRRLSSNLQQPTITNHRSSSISSMAITPRPVSSSHHSFSHLTPPPSGYSEEQQYQIPAPSITIASIEERLEKIEKILWMILEKNALPLDHRVIHSNEESNPATMTIPHDPSIRLPPLYNHHHFHSPPITSPCFDKNSKTSSSTTSTTTIRSLIDSETSNVP